MCQISLILFFNMLPLSAPSQLQTPKMQKMRDMQKFPTKNAHDLNRSPLVTEGRER